SSIRRDAWVLQPRSGSGNKVSAPASGTPLEPPGRGIIHPGRTQWPIDLLGGGFRNGASCRTSFCWQIAVELAEQSVAVFLGPVSEVSNEVLDLFACGFT